MSEVNETVILNGIIEYDEKTGLKIHNKGEILQDLEYLTKIAYGNDYVIEQGNEWYSFLDLLATSLAKMGGATQSVYDSLSFVSASGTNLDNVVSFAGIKRKANSNSTVVITATLNSSASVTRPYVMIAGSVTLKDSNGNFWRNVEDITIERFKKKTSSSENDVENYVGTAKFEATDANISPTTVQLLAKNNSTNTNLEIVAGSMPANSITFINDVSSESGSTEETDAQLRARYRTELYRSSVGTLEGLKSQILELSTVNYVNILENTTSAAITDSNSEKYGMPAHSIWVIVDGTSTWKKSGSGNTGAASIDVDDLAIAEKILNYKAMGCAVVVGSNASSYNATSGTGSITTNITRDSSEYEIKFTRATPTNVSVKINISGTVAEDDVKESIIQEIKTSVANYVNNLGISNDVLYGGTASAVYNVITNNNYKDYVFDITSMFIALGEDAPSSGTRATMKVFQYPVITEDRVTVTWS